MPASYASAGFGGDGGDPGQIPWEWTLRGDSRGNMGFKFNGFLLNRVLQNLLGKSFQVNTLETQPKNAPCFSYSHRCLAVWATGVAASPWGAGWPLAACPLLALVLG